MKDSNNALYQSKISNKSSKEKILVKKIIPFGDDDHEISSYLAKYFLCSTTDSSI